MSALRVLVVEDDYLIGMLLSETLAGMGHHVCAIEATEAGAVTTAIRLKPGLMIVEDQLRKGSGVSAVAAILRSDAIPHVFVSGDTVRLRALGPDSVVLRKPYKELDLARAIERALHRGRIIDGSPVGSSHGGRCSMKRRVIRPAPWSGLRFLNYHKDAAPAR